MEKKEEKEKSGKIMTWYRKISLRGLFGMIIILLFILIIMSSFSFLPGLMSRISSSLSAALYSIFIPAKNATMTIDKKNINSNEDFTISFKKNSEANGLFTISYPCESSVNLFSIESTGLKEIQCANPYFLLEVEQIIQIRAETDRDSAQLTIEGFFENSDDQKTEKVGVVRITIKNDNIDTINTNTGTTNEAPVTDSNLPNTTDVGTTLSINYSKPDLAIRLLQIGSLIGKDYIQPQTSFNYSASIGIKFEVRNDGGAPTGVWYFRASLPSVSTPFYSSNPQISLRPGESIIYTLGFSNLLNEKDSLILIAVDPQNIVNESQKNNNIITASINNIDFGDDYYNNNDNLEVSCYASPDDPETGDRVRWYADVSGGDGDYDYDWSGTNGLDSSSRTPSKTYTSRGTKRATITVKSDGQKASDTCSVYID